MKLAFCLYKYSPFGGLQRDFMRIATECKNRGHKISVFTMQWEGDIPAEFEINLIKPKGVQNHSRAKDFARQVQPQLKGFDLVMGFNKMPGLDIYYAADTCFQSKSREKRGIIYRMMPRYKNFVDLEEKVFKKALDTKILLLSEKQRVDFKKYYFTEDERFCLLPPGIDKNRINVDDPLAVRKNIRKEFNIKNSEYLLLHVGSGFKTKGLDRSLKAIAALPLKYKNKLKFFVIGKDKSKSFKDLAKKLKIIDNIEFLGGRLDAEKFMYAADLLIHPAYFENTGTVLLEALVAGLPVLTTDVCGYANYIDESKSGVSLKSPFCQKDFNELLEISLNEDTRAIWQENALEYTKDANIYGMVNYAVDLIEKTYEKKLS